MTWAVAVEVEAGETLDVLVGADVVAFVEETVILLTVDVERLVDTGAALVVLFDVVTGAEVVVILRVLLMAVVGLATLLAVADADGAELVMTRVVGVGALFVKLTTAETTGTTWMHGRDVSSETDGPTSSPRHPRASGG